MKIIHTSDLHLDSPLTGRLSPEKIAVRKRELFDSFYKIAKEAERVGASLFIIAGDLFDRAKISRRAAESVLNTVAAFDRVQFLYLPGNHEKDGLLSSGLDLPDNFHIFGKDWTYFHFDGVTVAGRSEITKDMFSTLSLSEDRSEITKDMFSTLSLSEDRINIAVLHGALADTARGVDGIGLRDAAGRNIDYLALGHYHSYSSHVIDRRGIAVYCGTPEGRGFDEVGECGYVTVDTDGGIRHEFIPSATRRILEVRVDITGAEKSYDIECALRGALREIPPSDMVRAHLVGTRQAQLYVDVAGLSALLGNSFFHFELTDETRGEINAEDYRYDKSLKGEFIRLVTAREDIPEKEKERIIRCGISVLMGEEPEV